MPRLPKQKIQTEKQATLALADALRAQARFPNIFQYAPHEKQRRFHESLYPKKQFVGGNRSGKTTAGAAEAVWYMGGEHPYKRLPWTAPTRGRIVTVDVAQGIEKIIKPMLSSLIPKSWLINGSWEDSYDKELRTLTLANGSFAEIMTYEQDLGKFAGTTRHWCWFDEEPTKEIFTECNLRLLDTAGHWWITMTPVEGMTWTYDEIYAMFGIDPYLLVIEVDMDDNPYLTEEGKELALSGLSQEDLDARQHGRYVSVGGLVYPEFDPIKHVIDPVSTPPGWLRFDAMDHGIRNPTAWLFCCVDKDGRIIILDEHYEAGRIVSHHAKIVKEKDAEFGFPAYRVGDPSIRNTDPITGTSVQLEYIFNDIPIILGNNDVSAGIIRIKSKLLGTDFGGGKTPELYITRNCDRLIWELRKYRWGKWAHKKMNYDRNAKEEPVKKDDHACDSLRYALASRPEVDDGTTIPDPTSLPLGATDVVEIDKPYTDKELTAIGRKYVDFHIGEEY
jgi:phage terminase large subunit-like protein